MFLAVYCAEIFAQQNKSDVLFHFFFQSISLGIFRSDYLIETTAELQDQWGGYSNIKQVELNTISLGGISFSCLVADMHR